MKLERIGDLEGFRRLREPWNELVAGSGLDHAFMRHEWFDAWVRHLGDPAGLAVLAGWRDGQLVAAAPLQVRRARIRRIPVREMTFLSSGVSPRCGFLVRDTADAAALLDATVRGRGHDLALLRNLPLDDEATRRCLDRVGSLGASRRFTQPGRISPYLLTAGDFDTYWGSLSGNVRGNVNRGVNRLKKAGHEHTIEHVDDGATFSALFPELLEASARSWKGQVGTDLESQEGLRRFYLDVSDVRPGLFEAWVLRINGRVAAFDYYLKGPRALSLIRTDFDPEFRRFNPGNVLRARILREVFDREGAWEFDMGGRDYDYKGKWVDRARAHRDAVIATGTLRGRLAVGLWKTGRWLAARRRAASGGEAAD